MRARCYRGGHLTQPRAAGVSGLEPPRLSQLHKMCLLSNSEADARHNNGDSTAKTVKKLHFSGKIERCTRLYTPGIVNPQRLIAQPIRAPRQPDGQNTRNPAITCARCMQHSIIVRRDNNRHTRSFSIRQQTAGRKPERGQSHKKHLQGGKTYGHNSTHN